MEEKRYADKIIINEDWLDYIIKSITHKYNYLIGSYRSSKTTFNVLAYGIYLNGLDYDATHLVLASSSTVAKMLVEDNSGFGLKAFFAERYNRATIDFSGQNLECGIITNQKGRTQRIIYLGGAKANSYTTFRGISLESVMIEEADLMHENTIEEAKGRTWAAKNPKYFLSQNPSSDKVPSRKWLTELLNNTPDSVNFARKSIFNNPALSAERVNEIISEHDENSIFYHKFILGEDALAEGLIYHLEEQNYIEEFSKSRYTDYIITIDPGKTKSATSMIAMGRNVIEKTLDVTHELRHRNNDNMSRPYTSEDYARLACQFISDCVADYGRYPKLVIIDSFRGDDFYENLQKMVRRSNLPIDIKFPIRSDGKDGKDEVPVRITRGLDLLFRHKLRFNRRCKYTINDFLSAKYDNKLLETKGIETRSDEFNEDGHLDCIDAVEYSFCYYSPILNSNGWLK